MTLTIDALLRARAGDEGTALAFEDDRWTWDEHVRASAARAAWLREVRRPGPFHVGILLDNVPEFSLLLGATAMAGAVGVGLNATRSAPDLARDAAHTDCQIVLTEDRHRDRLRDVDLPPDRIVSIDSDRWGDIVRSHDEGEAPDAGPGEDDLFMLIFTSGTTAAPKAVTCTHGKIAFQGSVIADMFGLGPDDVAYVSMPLFHSNAVIAGWGPMLAAGGTIALRRKFSASAFLDDVRRFGATYTNYVGKPLAYVLAQPERDDDADNSLRLAFGNEASPRDVRRFSERFACRVIDAFGSTEGGISMTRTEDTPLNALGVPVGDVRVLDPETGEECPPGEFDASGRLLNPDDAIGEMVNLDGAGAFEGYWNNEEATRERLRDGRYWSGDLAYRDADGFFYFAGRTPDWIRVDGENLAAAPIERVVVDHPDVVDAAVYAVPDPVAGDQIMTAIVLRPRVEFDPDAFAEWLDGRDDLGDKASPAFVRVAEELPMTPTNKVIVRALVTDAWRCEDPVWWRPRGQTGFVPFGVAERQGWEDRFADAGRDHLLPSPSADGG